MFRALLTRLLGRTGLVRTQPEEAVATLGNSSVVGAPLNTLASPGVLGADPPTQAARPSRPSILSCYSRVNLADNPLAIREVRQTGPITWAPGLHGWCINPSTSFPLTVVGSDNETACQIREALDGLVDHYSEDVTEAVAGLVVQRGARFHEFEDYLEAQRQTYRAALAAARSKRTGRARQEDDEVEEEVEADAVGSLDRCCHQFAGLIEGDYPNGAAELSAVRSFGYGNLLRYLGAGPANVKLIPPRDRRRLGFEALVQAELAIGADRISEIPTVSLLHAMTLKGIHSLSALPIPSKLRKKDLAVEFVLGQGGIRERVIAATDLEAVFYLLPPVGALSALDLGGMRDRMSFAWGVTNLVVTTYVTAALAPTNREYAGKHLAADRFKVHNIGDILGCRSCSRMRGESRALAEWSRFPFHFGCRCVLLLAAR
jgi:hypothetical protein